jgi:hypothetical protein
MAQSAGAPMMRWFRSVVASVAGGEVVISPSVVAGVVVGVASYLVGPNRGDVRVNVAMASMAPSSSQPALHSTSNG